MTTVGSLGRRRPRRRHRRPRRHRDHPPGCPRRSADGAVRSVPADRRCCVGYLHPEDDADVVRRRRLLPHRRSGPTGSTTTTSWSPAGPRTSSSATARTSPPRRSRTCSIGHPDIAEIAIVGLPDPRTGERACAVIVPRRSARPDRGRPARVPGGRGRRQVQECPNRWSSGTPCPRTTRARFSSIGSEQSVLGDIAAWSDMQVAIVTGASSGIGFGCATKLAETGMAVVGTGRDPDRLADLEKAIGDPDRVATLAVDLTADDAPQRIVDAGAVARWGRIDFLVNNAGVGSPKPLHETDDEIAGLLPGSDAAGTVPAGPRRDPAHAVRARRSSTSRRRSPSSAACAAARTRRPRAA